MPGFIHGELNWVDPPASARGRVEAMVRAVDHYPWEEQTLAQSSSSKVNLAVAAQGFGRGHPHFAHEDDQLMVFCDLQLHGREDLASRLDDASRPGDSDVSLLTGAYRRWGIEFGAHVIGEGSIAVWDRQAERLVIWRDPAGARPMYYLHLAGRALVFSSDLLALAAHPLSSGTFDIEYVSAFVRNELFQHPRRTLHQGVHKLPAGHILVVERRRVETHRYWDPRDIEPQSRIDDDEAVAELNRLLRLATSDRISHAAGSAAAHLSGGLDSSGAAVTASDLLRETGNGLHGFSWAPPRDVVGPLARDERDLVDAVAAHGAIEVHYTELSPHDIVNVAYRDVALRPRATLNFEVAASRNAVEHGAGTIISGWGGDEMIAFNGRGHFSDLARRGRLLTLRRELARRAGIQGGSLLGAWKALVLMPLTPDRIWDRGQIPVWPLPAELRPEFAQELLAVDPLPFEFPRERPGVHRMQADLVDFGHLQFRMESWAAHGAGLGLTYTYPLLDRRVMEFAMSLPGRMFFRDGWKRWLYRTAMEGRVPEVVRWNPKKYDDAAGRHLRQVLLEPTDLYRDPLVERQDNPFVDVQVLVDEQLRRRSNPDVADVPSDPGTPIGGGAWLAFTALRPS